MHNLCFATSLTSTKLASWVQALGSIFAIFVAIYISNRQSNKQFSNSIKLLNADKNVSLNNKVVAIHSAFLMIASTYISFLKEIPTSKDFDNLNSSDLIKFNTDHEIDVLKKLSVEILPFDVFTMICFVIKSSDNVISELNSYHSRSYNLDDKDFLQSTDLVETFVSNVRSYANQLESSYSLYKC